MTDPFELLKVPESADDQEIRAAYLARVREFPPERAPTEFQAVREAYERIKTEKARITYLYITHPEIGSESILRMLLKRKNPGRPSEQQFTDMLAASIRRIQRPEPSER